MVDNRPPCLREAGVVDWLVEIADDLLDIGAGVAIEAPMEKHALLQRGERVLVDRRVAGRHRPQRRETGDRGHAEGAGTFCSSADAASKTGIDALSGARSYTVCARLLKSPRGNIIRLSRSIAPKLSRALQPTPRPAPVRMAPLPRVPADGSSPTQRARARQLPAR